MRGKQHLLSSREKDVIRHSACGQCKAEPIIENGEHCHPHRIIHGADGGLYTAANTVSRCPSCHDIEHGGDGTAPFIGAAREAGLIGGRKGGLVRMAMLSMKERRVLAQHAQRYSAGHNIKHTLKTRKKISINTRKAMQHPKVRKRMCCPRKRHPQKSLEHRAKISAAVKRAWTKPHTRLRFLANLTQEKREEAAKRGWIKRRKSSCL